MSFLTIRALVGLRASLMTRGVDMQEEDVITLDEQIAEAQRELALRRKC